MRCFNEFVKVFKNIDEGMENAIISYDNLISYKSSITYIKKIVFFKEIDTMVYELYDLTDEEIATIEND